MARRFGRTVVRSTKRGSVWLGLNIGATAIPASSAVLVGSLNAAALALRPFTVVRTRFVVRWASDQVAAIEDPHGALGMIVVTDTAVAAGVASIPTPTTNTNAGWFVHQPLLVGFDFITGVGFDSNAGMQYTVDSKAMRKVGDDDQVPIVVDNNNGADAAIVTMIGRMLVKLH